MKGVFVVCLAINKFLTKHFFFKTKQILFPRMLTKEGNAIRKSTTLGRDNAKNSQISIEFSLRIFEKIEKSCLKLNLLTVPPSLNREIKSREWRFISP